MLLILDMLFGYIIRCPFYNYYEDSNFQTNTHLQSLFYQCLIISDAMVNWGHNQKITNVVLTSALRNLAEKNLVTREQFNEISPHVEYSLTERGKGMLPIFYEMICWEEKYQ